MTSVLSATLVRRAGVKQLILFHLSERYRREEWIDMLREARVIFPHTRYPAQWRLAEAAEEDGFQRKKTLQIMRVGVHRKWIVHSQYSMLQAGEGSSSESSAKRSMDSLPQKPGEPGSISFSLSKTSAADWGRSV